MTDTPEKKLHDILKSFDTAMLVTRSPSGELRARPMAIARIDRGDDLWFFTDIQSGKIDEIRTEPHVNVSLQNGSQYLSLSGKGSVVQDRVMIEELWQESYKVWFPGGKDDPNISLLRVTTTEGEYWDNAGAQGLKYLFEAGKAYLTGQRPELDADIHQKVDLR